MKFKVILEEKELDLVLGELHKLKALHDEGDQMYYRYLNVITKFNDAQVEWN